MAILQNEHVGESLSRQYLARLGNGVASVNHGRITGNVDDLLGRVHGEWLLGHAYDLLRTIQEPPRTGDVSEIGTQDGIDSVAVPVGDRRQPSGLLRKDIGARADVQWQRSVAAYIRTHISPAERGCCDRDERRGNNGKRHDDRDGRSPAAHPTTHHRNVSSALPPGGWSISRLTTQHSVSAKRLAACTGL